MNATTFPKYTTKTTLELKIGDVVRAHGVRLRLTRINVDAKKAKSLADSHKSLMLHYARTEQDQARIEVEYARSLTLRNFSVEFVGYLHQDGGNNDLSPAWWNRHYTVQGNHLATWPVENA